MAEQRKQPHLNVDEALHIAGNEGPLARILKGFEARPQQQAMLRDVVDAYNDKSVVLIEAGTGTGKSLAYLIPALLCALQHKERTVITTHTITLQEQLIHKDIPQLLKTLNIDVKAVLVKGMNNYLCLRKLEETAQEQLLMSQEELSEFSHIEAWAASTQDGSRSSLSTVPSMPLWERLGAEGDTCSNAQCPHYQRCFFFKARRQAEDAQILVVNHHLLFADLSIRAESENYTATAILPYYRHVIIDEAHHIEDVATDFFGERISKLGFLRNLKRLASETSQKNMGKIALLRLKLMQFYPNASAAAISSIFTRLNIDLPAKSNELQAHIQYLFQAVSDYADQQLDNDREDSAAPESKLRLFSEHFFSAAWQEAIAPKAVKLIATCKSYLQSMIALENDLKEVNDDRFQEQSKSLRADIIAFSERLTNHSNLIHNLVLNAPSKDKVHWIESTRLKTGRNIGIVSAHLDISKLLASALFSKFEAIILCSATLATNQRFDFIQQRLGITEQLLPEKKIVEKLYDSPFNYSKQALLLIPNDLPPPQSSHFTLAASEQIWQAIEASRGSTFVLFTSYGMMNKCHEILGDRLQSQRYHLFKQGEGSRQKILYQFKNTPRSVLFGTDSFWEGVDVSGEALRCVVIVKLPFRVPTEPIIQARTEAIVARGGDPFTEYSLPNAIVKFKQGFGRLIRHNNDRGCIICLDSRLITKGYGKFFLDSLPDCQRCLSPAALIEQQMRNFYRRTHHLIIQ